MQLANASALGKRVDHSQPEAALAGVFYLNNYEYEHRIA